tara:strand:+ start:1713 stop:2264 length:552 start_codon:yes stop_codon:yes gene_type:complete
MVKNTGGKHNKKIARKSAGTIIEKKLRVCEQDDEIYGIVSKCLGNGRFLIICNDQVERICFLRNKFTGRNKHGNLVSIGSWVIIGLRNWETIKPNKKDKCDLLEIYTNNEKHKLLQDCKTDISFLTKQENVILNIDNGEQNEESDSFIFQDESSSINQNVTIEKTEIDDTDIYDCGEINFDEI